MEKGKEQIGQIPQRIDILEDELKSFYEILYELECKLSSALTEKTESIEENPETNNDGIVHIAVRLDTFIRTLKENKENVKSLLNRLQL